MVLVAAVEVVVGGFGFACEKRVAGTLMLDTLYSHRKWHGVAKTPPQAQRDKPKSLEP